MWSWRYHFRYFQENGGTSHGSFGKVGLGDHTSVPIRCPGADATVAIDLVFDRIFSWRTYRRWTANRPSYGFITGGGQGSFVVLVTHDQVLAKYATRIIQLMDGRVVADSDPLILERKRNPRGTQEYGEILHVLFHGTCASFNNLRTKRGRTILTAFAGSIGIIGIALIMALQRREPLYAEIQRDTMTSYPITIEAHTFDLSGIHIRRNIGFRDPAELTEFIPMEWRWSLPPKPPPVPGK